MIDLTLTQALDKLKKREITATELTRAYICLLYTSVSQKLPEFPLVLHGASSVPQDLVEMINKFGGKLTGCLLYTSRCQLCADRHNPKLLIKRVLLEYFQEDMILRV